MVPHTLAVTMQLRRTAKDSIPSARRLPWSLLDAQRLSCHRRQTVANYQSQQADRLEQRQWSVPPNNHSAVKRRQLSLRRKIERPPRRGPYPWVASSSVSYRTACRISDEYSGCL